MKLTFIWIFVFLLTAFSCSKKEIEDTIATPLDDYTYFPPLDTNTWETISLSELNWNENEMNTLLDFLKEKNTKSFIILYRGKMVVEKYFNNHNSNSLWYWASAGKTLTTAIIGIAQHKGLLNIHTKVSDYLGVGWTSLPESKENLITCKNLLSMNSGLDDTLGDSVSPENLKYLADAGTRWAYHNAYVKLQVIVENVSKQSWSNYFNETLKNKIGMTGSWRGLGDLSVYWSTTRSMARFGLLMAANGTWINTQIIPEKFIQEAINTSQNINQAYGYLWWLNGKSTYHLPQTQATFKGKLVTNAPDDMIAALGKNDQKIYIVPSKKLVIIRMGESADSTNFALSNFDNELWTKINAVIN